MSIIILDYLIFNKILMDNKIDQLKTEANDITKSLNELKNNVSLSEDEKKTKAETLKSQAEATKQKIENEIHSLESKTDDDSKKKKEEAETLLKSFNETIALYTSILNTWSTNVPSTATNSEDEKKWFFWRATDWVWEQWNDVWDKDKRKDEWWKNLLRTAWFVVTWVWAISLAVKWIKRLFWKDKKKEEESDTKEDKKEKKKPWWKRFLIWSAIAAWTVIWWVEIYKHRNVISSWVKEKLWLALSFDEAKQKVENEVRNWIIDDDHFWEFKAHFEWWITFDEQTQEICSYGQKTKIEKKWKKLQWMDVEFASWEELIHAANIVNFAKRRLAWRWASSSPFSKTNWWWDIAFTCSANWKQEFMSANNSNEWSWILWTVWTAGWWLLWWYCAWVKWAAIWTLWGWLWWYALWAFIDNTSAAWKCCKTIARWRNFDLFLNYLNEQKDENWKSLWESAWEQRIDPDWTPINWLVDNWAENPSEWEWVLAEIEKEYWEDQTWRRKLKIERWWNEPWGNPEEYRIKSYNHEVKLTLKWWPTKKWDKIDYSKITEIHIEKYKDSDWWDWLDIAFPKTEKWLKEAIRVANLTNMIREDWSKKWQIEFPFCSWMYSFKTSLEINVPWMWTHLWWTTVLSEGALKDKYPTLYKDLKKFKDGSPTFAAYDLVWMKKVEKRLSDQARNDESKGSQYIKFLHQIRDEKGGSYWKK